MPKFRNSVNKYYEKFTQIGESKAREMRFEMIHLGITVIYNYLNTTLSEPGVCISRALGRFLDDHRCGALRG